MAPKTTQIIVTCAAVGKAQAETYFMPTQIGRLGASLRVLGLMVSLLDAVLGNICSLAGVVLLWPRLRPWAEIAERQVLLRLKPLLKHRVLYPAQL